MHFRNLQSKQSRATSSPPDMLAYKHEAATVQTTELLESPIESPEIMELETPGIACWDFAYPTGKCSLPSSMTMNCCFSRQHTAKAKPSAVAPAHEALKDSQQSRPQPRPHQKTQKTRKHSSLSLSSSSSKSDSSDSGDSKTYLLSSPTQDSILNLHTQDTISSLLTTPNTKIVYLVPQFNIVCPKVCAMMRLPRAKGTSFQVLPVPPEIIMTCSSAPNEYDDDSDEQEKTKSEPRYSITDVLAIQEVAAKVVKNTKVRHFDGYMAFVEEREAWTFLELVGKKVSEAAVNSGGAKGKKGR